MDRDSPAPKPFHPAHSDAPPLPAAATEGGLVLLVAASGADDREWAERSATALAAGWVRQGRRVLLADLGLSRPSLHTVLGVANGEGVSDTFLFGSSIQRVARPVREGGFLFISAGTATARPDTVIESPRWTSVVEGCARVQATLVVYLPSDLPGGETLLGRASDVVLLTDDASGGAALKAGLGDRLRAVLVPPGAEPAPADGDGDAGLGFDLAIEPEPAATAGAADFLGDLVGEAPPGTGPGGGFSDADLAFAMPVEDGGAAQGPAPTFGGLSFVEPEPEPLPVPAVAAHRVPDPPPASVHKFTRVDVPAAAPAPRPASSRPAARAPARPEPKAGESRVGVLLLALAVVVVALLAAARFGVVEIPYLSDWLAAPAATATVTPAPTPVLAEPTAEAPVLALSLTLDSFTDPALARLQASALSEQRPDLVFAVAPVSVDGTVYYRLLAGPAADSASAAELRATLATMLTRENPRAWVLRPTPLAFNLGEREELDLARTRVAELSRMDIPAYVLEVPVRTPAGARRAPFRVYAGAYADELEAAYFRDILVAKGFPDARLMERIGHRPE